MKQFYGYIRVSTVKQGEHGVSLVEQKAAIESYCQRTSLNISRWFEEQETAAKRGRPVFGQMIKLLRTGKASGVIMHKIDRSARNLKDWADLGELIDAGVEVYFANESLDMNSRGGRLSADIQAVVAADFIRNLREETKKGIYGRLKQGLYPMPAPLGYLNSSPGKPKSVDPEKSPLIRQAFELYSTGRFNIKELAQEMFKVGFRSKTGGMVKHGPLQKVITNPFYTGIIKVKKTGQTFDGCHEAIISTSLYQRAQEVLSGKTHRKGQKHYFTFRQLFLCEHCKHSLIGERQKGIVYYRCHTIGCPSATLPERTVDMAIVRQLIRLECSQEEKDYFRKKFGQMKLNWQGRQQTLIQSLKLQLEQTESRQNRLTDAYLDQAIEKDVFEQRKTALQMERRQLQEQLQKLNDPKASVPDQLQELVELASHAYLAYKHANPFEKPDLVKTLSSNRSLENKELKITLKFPFNLIGNRFVLSDGCPTRTPRRDVVQVWDALIDKLLEVLLAVPLGLPRGVEVRG
jgi:DNA invertase Pin-like site-specific DNA recombinase